MLRITAGEYRGRKLKVPKVRATRPLTERAREGVFNHLGKMVREAQVWDIYAGSGVLGLEAISRGASQVIAVEKNKVAIDQIKLNTSILGCELALRTIKIDANRAVEILAKEVPPHLIFFDPPYDDFRKGGPRRLKAWALFKSYCDHLVPGGCGIVHTPKGLLNDNELEQLPGINRRDYGSASLYWWHKR